MTSEVEICKLALSHIRGGNINSLDDNTKQAQECKLHYPILRDQLLENTPWQFAQKVRELAVLTDEVHGWAYVYQYPNDCWLISRLKSDPVIPDDVTIPYSIFNVDDNKVIVTNTPCIHIEYRAKITKTSLFSPDFVSALSHLLAANIAMNLIGGQLGAKLRLDELGLYNQIIQTAMANNANEQVHVVPESEFITVRDGYGRNSSEEFYRR